MPESQAPIQLRGLNFAKLRQLIKERRLPPVERWNPEQWGHSQMRIGRDGTWYHQGSVINRPELVRLFSTVLRREPDGQHMLVTPQEKLVIEVDSTAFRAIDMTIEGQGRDQTIAFLLDSGDAVILGPDHPLSVVESHEGVSPRIVVRHGLEAELSRRIYYELADLALAEEGNQAGLWSNGAFFRLEPQL